MAASAPQSIAIVSNAHTPYRRHLHERIAREIPEVHLWSLYTHETSNAPWTFDGDDQTHPVIFGKGESSDAQSDPKNSLREWRRGGTIIRWMKEHQIRFVVMLGYNDMGRIRMIRWCRRNKIPCWLFGDSNILGDRTGGLKAYLKRLAVERIVSWCDGILRCGQLGTEYFIKYGADPTRLAYFPYEPDYALIQNITPEQMADAARRFALSADRRRIVFSGRLVEVKRPDLLIDAFAAIAARRPKWDLLIIGDGALRQELKQRLPAALAERVRWTGFLDDQTTMSALYRQCDVLALPSDYEPWALVINEAVAAGLAVVSSNVVGAAAELVRDGSNGRLFPPGDLPALTAALLDVTDDAKIDAMKAASAGALADWRKRADPVNGLRNALAMSGLIK
jgi:glycosyltransferase involved in cell wall biosynthesis